MAKTQNLIDNYLNSLNEAMAIHAKNAVENIGFDKTELCEIVNDTNKDKGWYIVWNGSVRYQAHSENHDYNIGTKVYVKIPNNDYSGQKQITGLYSNGTTAEEYSATYEMPLNTIKVYKENNLLNSISSNEYGLLANYNKAEHKDGEESIVLAEIEGITSGYRYLGLAANFKTLLPEMSMGNYGIRLVVTLGDGQEQILALDTTDMVGNLYSFSSYIQQQKVFDISKLNISKIRVEFYQSGNFYNKGEKFNGVIDENHYLPDNILTKGLELYYGDYKVTVENDLKLLSNSLIYNSSWDENLNHRTIDLEWIYTDLEADEDKQESIYIRSDRDIPSKLKNVKIYWYKSVDMPTVEYVTTGLQEAISRRNEENKKISNFFEACLDRDTEAEEASEDENIKKYIFPINGYVFESEKEDIFNDLIDNVFNGIQFKKEGANIQNPYYKEDILTIYQIGLEYLNDLMSSNIEANDADEKYLALFSNPRLGNEWFLLENSKSSGNDFSKSDLLDLNNPETKYKVALEYGPWKTEINDEEEVVEIEGEYDTTSSEYSFQISEELVFTNEADIKSELEKKQEAMQIIFSDNSDGVYAIYDGTSGNAINPNEPLELKEFTVVCNQDNDTGINYLNDSDIVVWEIPKNRTMIKIDEDCYNVEEEESEDSESENEESTEEESKNDKEPQAMLLDRKHWVFTYYKDTIPYNGSNLYIKHKKGDFSQKFKVAPKFVRTATQNTIKCYVIQTGGVIVKEMPLTFTQFSYTGSDYTFSLALGQLFKKNVSNGKTTFQKQKDEVDNFIELPMADNMYREIEIKLYDIKGREVALTAAEKNDIMLPWINNDLDGFYCGYKDPSPLEFIAMESDDDSHILRIGVRVKNNPQTVSIPAKTGSAYSVPRSLSDFYSIILQANYIREKEAAAEGEEEDLNNSGRIAYNQILPLNFKIKYADSSESFVGLKTLNIQGPNYVVYEHTGGNPKTNPEYSSYSVSSPRDKARVQETSEYAKNFETARRNRNKAALLNINDHEDHEIEGKTESGWDAEMRRLIDNYNSTIAQMEQAEKLHTGKNIPGGTSYTYGTMVLGDQNPRDNYPSLNDDGDLLLKREYIDGLNKNICFVLKQVQGSTTVDLCTMPLAILKNRFSVCGQNVWINNIQLINDQTLLTGGRRLLRSTNPLVVGEIVDAAVNVTKVSNTGKINSVLIGNVLNKSGQEETGLFGYYENSPVFAVKTDGTAFLGKEGQGRINFDGNGGTITSNAYEESYPLYLASANPETGERDSSLLKGNLIDLKNSEIDLRSNKAENSSWVHIGANSVNLVTDADKDIVYFSVNEKEGNRLISIGDIDTRLVRYTNTDEHHRKNDINYQDSTWGNFFIKTKDFKRPSATSEGAGLRIDLSTGNFESYSDFTIMSSDFITFDGKTQITDTLDIFSNTSINGRLDIAGSLNFISYQQNNTGAYYRIAVDANNGVYRYVKIIDDDYLNTHQAELDPSMRYNQLMNEVKTDSNQNLVISSADLSDLGSLDLTVFSNYGSPTATAQNPVTDNVFIQRKDLNTALNSYVLTSTLNDYSLKSEVPGLISVTQVQTSTGGTKIATVNGTDLYAPTQVPTDLSNYYTKSEVYSDEEVYSKAEINRLIDILKNQGITIPNDWYEET